MADKYIDELYNRFTTEFLTDISSNAFYDYFINMVRSKNQDITVYEKYIERTVDMKWVEAIEKTIIPLDNIIRNPKRYIRRDEDVVRIELARDIGPEAVRHLAQHTSMIAKVEDGDVTPERILNITKEEALDTYENRFIYTLLKQVEYFLDRRLAVLNENTKVEDRFEYSLEGTAEVGDDNLDYSFQMNFTTPHDILEENLLLDTDPTKLTNMERVNRVRKIIYSFRYSPFAKALAGSAPVRPPLTMTNVLTKNQDFVQAVKLWNFVSSYNDVGFTMDFVDRQVVPGDKALNELYSVTMLQYVLLKKYTHRNAEIGDVDERRQSLAPNIVKRNIDNIINTYNLDIDTVRRIFEDEIRKKERQRDAQFNKARGIVARAIELEEKLAAEENRIREERAERERKRLEAIRIAEEKKAERARKLAEQAAEKARKAAERAEAARLKKEAAEAARLERERIKAEKAEAARLAAEQHAAEMAAKKAERERKAAELAEQRRIAAEEREKARLERERIKAEEAEKARIERERLAAERAAKKAEEERIAAEKREAARIERERKAAEKAAAEEVARIEKERIAAEKAAKAAEEARIREEKLKEQARIAAEKAAKAEAARIEAERIAALMAPYKEEEERIEAGLEKAKKLSRKKKKATKQRLNRELDELHESMPEELKKHRNKK